MGYKIDPVSSSETFAKLSDEETGFAVMFAFML